MGLPTCTFDNGNRNFHPLSIGCWMVLTCPLVRFTRAQSKLGPSSAMSGTDSVPCLKSKICLSTPVFEVVAPSQSKEQDRTLLPRPSYVAILLPGSIDQAKTHRANITETCSPRVRSIRNRFSILGRRMGCL
jgi:hypothetical protein